MNSTKLARLRICLLAAVLGGAGLSSAALGQSLSDEPTSSLDSLLTGSFDPWNDPSNRDFAPHTAGDGDLGEQLVLMPLGAYRPFNFQLAQRMLWTNNAGLTDVGEFTGLGDVYSTTDLRLGYLPHLGGNTYGEISAGYAFYRYLDHSVLDFDRFKGSAGVVHAFRELRDLSGWLRYNHTRLLTARDYDDFFTDHSVEIGLYYPIPLGAGQSAFASYSSEFSLDANPGRVGRHEHAVMLGYRYAPLDRVELSGFYRFSLLDYRQAGRQDLLHSAGVAVTTKITDRIDIVALANYSINDSNTAGQDYEVGEVGASLAFRLEF